MARISRSYASSENSQRLVRQQLPHLADGHLVGHPAQHSQRLEIVQADELDDRARVQVVAHDDRHLVAEQGVDRGHATTKHRVVHRVVVHQGGHVDQLDHGRQRDRPRIARARRLVGQEQQRGPEHLPLHLEQVRVDLGDEPEVGLDDPAQFLRHPLQAARTGCWRSARVIGAVCELIRRRPAVSRWIRSLRSMNRMSTAIARS